MAPKDRASDYKSSKRTEIPKITTSCGDRGCTATRTGNVDYPTITVVVVTRENSEEGVSRAGRDREENIFCNSTVTTSGQTDTDTLKKES